MSNFYIFYFLTNIIMIEVTLRRVGSAHQQYSLDDGATVADFKAILSNNVATSGIGASNFAVRGNRVEESHVLVDGDTLSVVAKVDGGQL